MKNFNFRILAVMLISAAFFTSCGINKMVKNYESGVSYTPATNPLENHGGNVAANVSGDIVEGYFQRKAVVELTPVLKYEGGEKELSTVTLRGTRTTTQGTMINADRATSVALNNVVEYQPEMFNSELYIRGKIYKEGNADNATILPERKVADGVINTSQRLARDHYLSIAAHEYELETIITQKADLYFAYMRHNLNTRLELNRSDESQQRIAELGEFLKRGWEIKAIEVNAWASPEGEVAFNEQLAERRAQTGERYMNDMLTRLERELENPIERPELTVAAKGEDFEGFMTRLNASNLPDKQSISNVINAQIAPAERERRIKDMTLIYAEIEKILEPLRRAEFVVHSYEPKKTREEIASLATNNPAQLDEKELLYGATLHDNLQTQLAIYKSAQRIFPNSYKGFNNAAVINMKLGNVSEAASDLEKANQLAPGNGHVQNNLGVVATWNKDYEGAKPLFEAARAQGIDNNYNLGTLMIVDGQYQNAIAAFSGKTCTHNIALAQLMAGNAGAALSTLECAPESADVEYLKAVIHSRQNNTNRMYDALRKAVQMDASLKEVAAEDREFIRFFAQNDFQEIVR
jgi:tetratricopeptide (TPR) repeat protein